MEVYTKVEDLVWSPHPLFEGVQIKPLVTKKNDGLTSAAYWLKFRPASRYPSMFTPNRSTSFIP
jgi:hypothetical protein